METSEQQLARAVDQVLEPAWPVERRRARRRLAVSAFERWAGGMLALVALALVLHLAVGVVVPWVFYLVIGVVAAIAALPDARDRRHLER